MRLLVDEFVRTKRNSQENYLSDRVGGFSTQYEVSKLFKTSYGYEKRIQITLLAQSANILEIFAIEKFMNLTFLNRPQFNLNMLIKCPYTTSYLMAIVMLVLSFTVCKIMTVDMWMILTLAIRTSRCQI